MESQASGVEINESEDLQNLEVDCVDFKVSQDIGPPEGQHASVHNHEWP